MPALKMGCVIVASAENGIYNAGTENGMCNSGTENVIHK